MRVKLTPHARKRSHQRDISTQDIAHAIQCGIAAPGRNQTTIMTCWEINLRVVVTEPDIRTRLVVTVYRPLTEYTHPFPDDHRQSLKVNQ